jgi:hypothetical protein
MTTTKVLITHIEEAFMTRGKKPSVDYEKRLDWLNRSLRGETPPMIARKDWFDVRTVRKNIALAKEEADVAKARTMVFHDVLEKHYADICSFAEVLDSSVATEQSITKSLGDRMWAALKQHLPSSGLWRDFDRWNSLLENREKHKEELLLQIRDRFTHNSDLRRGLASSSVISEDVSNVLLFQAKQWVRKSKGLDVKTNLSLEPQGDGTTIVHYGAFILGPAPVKGLQLVRKTLEKLESELVTYDSYLSMKKTEGEIDQLKVNLRDELALIILKRIVSGRCRYCPI